MTLENILVTPEDIADTYGEGVEVFHEFNEVMELTETGLTPSQIVRHHFKIKSTDRPKYSVKLNKIKR